MVAHTGDRKGARTDADIAIRLMGRLDPRCPTRHKLGGSKSDFERASATLSLVTIPIDACNFLNVMRKYLLKA